MFCLNIANFKCCAVMFSSLGNLFVGGFAHWFEHFCKIRDDIIAKIISIVSSVKCEEFLDLTVTLKAILRWHICFMQWVLTKGNNEEKWFHALIRIDKYEPIYSTSANCTIWILSYEKLQKINKRYVAYILQDKIILQNDWYLQTRSCISNPTSYTKLTRHMLHISKKKLVSFCKKNIILLL